ncbi:hypothetical protein GS597_04305 [Synechococcales cyanobacterium C]|uniref:Uncharacterized protein n=2 Tax=Petrachloros TaxID=2918834 RepID=A0A8K2AC93_9CYAN|nr:hypothetical protein [Petrachloros mirabilis ULC683]
MTPSIQKRDWRFWSVTCVSSLLFIAAAPGALSAQQVNDLDGLGETQPLTPNNVEILSPTGLQSGLFSIQAGQRLMTEAEQAVSAQNYTTAASKLQDSRRVMNQLSNYYQALTSSFMGVDSRAADSLRRQALESAQLRDQATYQLALVYRAQNRPELAIPLFIEIVRSQNPTRDLGQKSYQQLLELGFVDVPFPRTQQGAQALP